MYTSTTILLVLFIISKCYAQLSDTCAAYVDCRSRLQKLQWTCSLEPRRNILHPCKMNRLIRSLKQASYEREKQLRQCIEGEPVVADSMVTSCIANPSSSSLHGCFAQLSIQNSQCERLKDCCPQATRCLSVISSSSVSKLFLDAKTGSLRAIVECRHQMNLVKEERANSEDVDLAEMILKSTADVMKWMTTLEQKSQKITTSHDRSMIIHKPPKMTVVDSDQPCKSHKMELMQRTTVAPFTMPEVVEPMYKKEPSSNSILPISDPRKSAKFNEMDGTASVLKVWNSGYKSKKAKLPKIFSTEVNLNDNQIGRKYGKPKNSRSDSFIKIKSTAKNIVDSEDLKNEKKLIELLDNAEKSEKMDSLLRDGEFERQKERKIVKVKKGSTTIRRPWSEEVQLASTRKRKENSDREMVKLTRSLPFIKKKHRGVQRPWWSADVRSGGSRNENDAAAVEATTVTTFELERHKLRRVTVSMPEPLEIPEQVLERNSVTLENSHTSPLRRITVAMPKIAADNEHLITVEATKIQEEVQNNQIAVEGSNIIEPEQNERATVEDNGLAAKESTVALMKQVEAATKPAHRIREPKEVEDIYDQIVGEFESLDVVESDSKEKIKRESSEVKQTEVKQEAVLSSKEVDFDTDQTPATVIVPPLPPPDVPVETIRTTTESTMTHSHNNGGSGLISAPSDNTDMEAVVNEGGTWTMIPKTPEKKTQSLEDPLNNFVSAGELESAKVEDIDGEDLRARYSHYYQPIDSKSASRPLLSVYSKQPNQEQPDKSEQKRTFEIKPEETKRRTIIQAIDSDNMKKPNINMNLNGMENIGNMDNKMLTVNENMFMDVTAGNFLEDELVPMTTMNPDTTPAAGATDPASGETTDLDGFVVEPAHVIFPVTFAPQIGMNLFDFKNKARAAKTFKGKVIEVKAAQNQSRSPCSDYRFCIRKLRKMEAKCAGEEGRLMPGLPKRRKAKCSRQLVPKYQEVDTETLALERKMLRCINENAKEDKKSISKQTVLKSSDMNCPSRLRMLKQQCDRIEPMCSVYKSCRSSVDSSELGRSLQIKVKKLTEMAQQCQIKSFEEYLRAKAKTI